VNDDDPLTSLLSPLFEEPAEREEPVIGPIRDDFGPVLPSVMDEPTSAPTDTWMWPMQDPHPEDIDREADLRSRLEFIRKELPPAQRREWMLRLLNQFSDLSEDNALFGELNNYMRLTQEEEHAAGEFWERTPQAWDHPHGGDYEDNNTRDTYRLV
jgi:hypothetical protein